MHVDTISGVHFGTTLSIFQDDYISHNDWDITVTLIRDSIHEFESIHMYYIMLYEIDL